MSKKNFMGIFEQMPDPRVERTKLHLLSDIVFITIAAVISGAEGWNEIEEYAQTKKKWLEKILPLPNGIPSHDTFNRFFSRLDPKAFEGAFAEWVKNTALPAQGQVVSIDGKTMRGARWTGATSAIHMVGAWASENELALGQIKAGEKSNEITAIPALLETMLLEGSTVTIDAMGCQEKIASGIVGRQADYILAVKDNQKELHENLRDTFLLEKPDSQYTHTDAGHGRVETRTCSTSSKLSHIEKPGRWKGLCTLVRIESERYIKASGKATKQVRYYISSLPPDSEKINHAVRSHWGIENKLHWCLDVCFGEDASRKRVGQAAQNWSIILRLAINMARAEKSMPSRSLKRKRLKAGWDNDYLLKIMKI